MEGQREESRQARVKRLLIEPLNEGGMGRKRGVSIANHDAAMGKAIKRLAYMSENGLKGLATYLIRIAGKQNVWPALNVILNAAWAIEVPPPRDNDYVLSVMKSRAGEAALDGGYALELFYAAKTLGPPPSRYQVVQLIQKAENNRHRVKVIAEKIATDRASAEDRRWLEGYHALLAQAEAMVFEGREKRNAA